MEHVEIDFLRKKVAELISSNSFLSAENAFLRNFIKGEGVTLTQYSEFKRDIALLSYAENPSEKIKAVLDDAQKLFGKEGANQLIEEMKLEQYGIERR